MPDAQFVRDHTPANTKTSGTTVAATVAGADVAIGNVLVIGVVADNLSSTTPTVSSISKPAGDGGTWAKVMGVGSSTATAAGGVVGELWAIKTTTSWPVGTTVTVTLSGAVAAKGVVMREYTNALITARGTAGSGTGTTGAPTSTTAGTAIVAGDLVLGLGVFENNVAPGADADTLNGSWDSGANTFTTGGTAATNVAVIVQHKIPTATGAQTYNPTGLSDCGACVIALQRDPAIALVVQNVSQAQTAGNVGLVQQHNLTAQNVAQTQSVSTIVFPFSLENSFEGGTNGATISTANSGGTNGDAFDVVGGTPAPTYSAADAIVGTQAGRATTTAANQNSMVQWTTKLKGMPSGYFRAYNKDPSLNTTVWTHICGAAAGATSYLRLRTNGTVLQILTSTDAVDAAFTTALVAGQPYRVEWFVDVVNDSYDVRLFQGAKLNNVVTDWTERITGTMGYTRTGLSYSDFGINWCGAAAVNVIDGLGFKTDDWPGPSVVSTTLTVQNVSQAQTTSNVNLVQQHNLTVQSMAQAQTVGNVELTQLHQLAVQNVSQAQTAGNVILVRIFNLLVQGAAQAQTADNVTLGLTGALSPSKPTTPQTVGNVVLTQVHQLVVQSVAQAQTAGNVALTQVHILTVAKATSAQTAQSPTLVQNSSLVVQNAAQAQTAQNLALVQQHNLIVAKATTPQTAPQVPMGLSVIVANASQAQTVQNVALTQAHNLSVQPAAQAQTSTTVSLAGASSLVAQNVSQAQTVNNLVILRIFNLLIQAMAQTQTVQSPILIRNITLVVAGVAQGSSASNLTLGQLNVLVVQKALTAQQIGVVVLATGALPFIRRGSGDVTKRYGSGAALRQGSGEVRRR